MAKVGIVMGSDSDMPVMAKAADILEELGISYEMTIISAQREPDVFFEYAKGAEEKGFYHLFLLFPNFHFHRWLWLAVFRPFQCSLGRGRIECVTGD